MTIKPADLAELILKCVEKRDWADYQRYLSDDCQEREEQPQGRQMNYQEFRTQDQHYHPNRQGR